jgi:hypothetical protein
MSLTWILFEGLEIINDLRDSMAFMESMINFNAHMSLRMGVYPERV